MWIVQLALRRPYTFVVMSLCIVVLGVLAMVRMPADIFPDINIPVVSVIWSYTGLSPEEMAEIITTRSERGFTTSVNDIEHMESTSLTGLSIIRLYFHPNARIDAAVSQLAAQSQSVVKLFPPGATAPSVIRYNAATVPILDLSLSSDTLTEQEEYDLGYNFIRTQLANVQGASIPLPYGGRPKQVMIDINPQALYSHGLGPSDVSDALNNQNLILPTGTAKIGTREYNVQLNNSPTIVDAFNRLPVKTVDGTTIYMRDVAQVRDGYAVQTNMVRHDGRRGALLTVLKNGSASTLDVVKRHQSCSAARAIDLALSPQSHPVVRSIRVRLRRDFRRGEGSHRRRDAHRLHDSAVPRKLAQHPDRLHFDSTFDSHLARRHVAAGRDDQHHDPGRPRARRRHSG